MSVIQCLNILSIALVYCLNHVTLILNSSRIQRLSPAPAGLQVLYTRTRKCHTAACLVCEQQHPHLYIYTCIGRSKPEYPEKPTGDQWWKEMSHSERSIQSWDSNPRPKLCQEKSMNNAWIHTHTEKKGKRRVYELRKIDK